MPEIPDFLTVIECAAALRVSRDAVYRLIAAGELRGYRFGKEQNTRVAAADLQEFIESRVVQLPAGTAAFQRRQRANHGIR